MKLIVDGMSVFKTLAGQAAQLDRGYAYSFLTQINSAVKKFSPDCVDVCWEGGFSKRSSLLPGYKSNRVESSGILREQRAELQVLLTFLGVNQHVAPEHEADDMIAFLANTREGPQIIMSADKDMLQLVSPSVSVFQKVRKTGTKSVRELITWQNFFEKTGWADPATYLQAHCALGDAVDQIPKIPGIGESVIHAYFMGAQIPEAKKRALDAFFADSEHYLLNKALIDLTKTDSLDYSTVPGNYSEGNTYGLLRDLGFASMADKFDTWIATWAGVQERANLSTIS